LLKSGCLSPLWAGERSTMSKYGTISRSDGNSKWFLQKTLLEHDSSMDHPWMQMIYKQCFSLKQYAAWLALNHKVFEAMEGKFDIKTEPLRTVHDDALSRTKKLEADLARLMGPQWNEEAAGVCSASPATKRYLAGLDKDAADSYLLLAHHFLQYNAVLSGGAYLGEMVSQKLCVPHGAPGVKFYQFEGVQSGKEPARVQEYLKAFDKLDIGDDVRARMLKVMKRIYSDTEAMMSEIFDMNPAKGITYKGSKDGANGDVELPKPCDEQLTLTLEELQRHTGEEGGRILLSLAGELLDVSAGREMYGPGGGYSVLAGHDVTRCLATMSLEPEDLDDLRWAPDCAEDEAALAMWRDRLREKYPVAGKLDASAGAVASSSRKSPEPEAKPEAKSETKPAETQGDGDRCPISGKQGTCPMAAIMGIQKPAEKAQPAKADAGKAGGAFMAGKSLVASVQKKDTSDDSLLYRLCPLHWDDKTIKMVVMIAAASWVSGLFVGWNLRKILVK